MEYLELSWLLFLFVSILKSFKGEIQEGDIYIPDGPNVQTFAAYTIQTKTWVSGQIPYNLDTSLSSTTQGLVRSAIQTIEQKTGSCVRFFPRTSSNTDYINITSANSGCYSAVGRSGGQQIVNVGPGCDTVGIIMHELLHALGFWHEQSRTDRDNYVNIIYDNILIGKKGEFNTRPDTTGVQSAVDYDFYSILHYKYNQFAEDKRKDTIVPIPIYNISKTVLGQREKLSDKDVKRIRLLYGCDKGACPRPDFENVAFSPVQTIYSVGDKITFSCRTGTLHGALSSECLAGGQWSEEEPNCLKISPMVCPKPNIQNVSFWPSQYIYHVGDKVHFACKAGTLIGANQTECLSTGAWSGAIPYCVRSNVRSFHFCDMEDCLSRWVLPRFASWKAFWQQHSGPTPTPHTGPDTDHTTENNSGHYLLMEADGVPSSQYALAFSPFVYSPSIGGFSVCVMFYYHMYGADLASTSYPSTLYVIIDMKVVWQTSGSTPVGNWTLAVSQEIHVARSTRVFIFTRRGNVKGARADVAVDDVFIGPCEEVYRYGNLTVASDTKPAEYDFFK